MHAVVDQRDAFWLKNLSFGYEDAAGKGARTSVESVLPDEHLKLGRAERKEGELLGCRHGVRLCREVYLR